jgi:predicted ribosome quality control (RQC) complex YloA/Tae2 family protein
MFRFYRGVMGEDAYDAAKEPLRAAIAEARARLTARLASLERSMTDDAERETLRQSGELILAYQYALRPGQAELRAQYDADRPELSIALDPHLTPLENAQRYFDRYNRAKRALDDVPALVEETRVALNYIDQLKTDLELATNWPEIDEVQQASQAGGYWRGKPQGRIAGGGKSAPLRIVKDGFVIWVGRNSRQNEIVTFDKGSPQDLWLHARDVPGAHVIIKNDGRPIPDSIIDAAASIAAYYSGSRGETRALVDVAPRRHVRKIKGGAPGMVTYRNEQTRTVTPRPESDL